MCTNRACPVKVRKAIKILEDEGIVTVVERWGTFVAERPKMATLYLCHQAARARTIAGMSSRRQRINATRPWMSMTAATMPTPFDPGPSRCRAIVIPEGAGPCQGGLSGGLGDWWACGTGLSCLLAAAMSVARRWARSRTGRGPAAGAAPEASLR